MEARNRKKQIYVIAIAFIISGSLLLFELGTYLTIKYLVYPQDKSAFYVPPDLDKDDYLDYLDRRDPELGWPSVKDYGGDKFDVAGARHSPAYPDPGQECVGLYGDSYTYGDEVIDDHAWGNVLASLLNCRVGNYGVFGYGTDQALLRYIKNESSSAHVTILGIFPYNVLRNINQYRYFLVGSLYGFKPRFILKNNQLSVVPLPKLSYEELQDSFSDPGSYFKHETFLPGSTYGPIPLRFPYSLVFVRYVMSERVINWIKGQPGWSGYVKPGHPSKSLEITTTIASNFHQLAEERGQKAIILLYPTARSYKYYIEQDKIIYQPLIDILEDSQIDYLDLHVYFKQNLNGMSICKLLTKVDSCKGHFNPEGNKHVAKAVYQFLKDSRVEFH